MKVFPLLCNYQGLFRVIVQTLLSQKYLGSIFLYYEYILYFFQ